MIYNINRFQNYDAQINAQIPINYNEIVSIPQQNQNINYNNQVIIENQGYLANNNGVDIYQQNYAYPNNTAFN